MLNRLNMATMLMRHGIIAACDVCNLPPWLNEIERVSKCLVFLLVSVVGVATAVRFVKKELRRAAKLAERD